MRREPFVAILFGSLASTGCDRPNGAESTRATVSAAAVRDASTSVEAASESGPATLSSAAETESSAAAGAPSASATPSSGAGEETVPPEDCRPLPRPPTSERRNLPQEGPYFSRVSYLYVTALDETIAKPINEAIGGDLAQWRRSFRQDADEIVTGSGGQDPLSAPNRMALDIRCDEAVATTRVLSIACDAYVNLGAAHPNDTHFTFNFAMCSGKSTALTLAMLCQPDRPWKQTILDLIGQALRRKLAKLGTSFLVIDEYASALETFVITRTGLRFFANDLPHVEAVAGTIDIPFTQLKSVLRRGGPLAGLQPP